MDVQIAMDVSSSLGRIFMKLRKHGKMAVGNLSQDSPQGQIVNWLCERYDDFVGNLLGLLDSTDAGLQMTAVNISLRLVKNETAARKDKFSNRTYAQFVDAFLRSGQPDDAVLKGFCEEYLNIFYDLQFYFLQNAAYVCV
jgi:hypothetical protein